MKIDELELIPHLLLLCYLVGCLHDLGRQSSLLVLVLLNQSPLLLVLLLKELFDPLGLDVARPAVFAPHQDLTLKIVGVLPDFSNCHVRLLENGSEGLEDGVGLYPAFFDGLLEGFGLLLCDFILFFRGEVEVDLLFLLPLVLFLFIVLFVLGVLFLETHEVRLEEIIFPPQMFDVLEVAFQLLGELLDGQQFLALLSGFEFPLAHQLYKFESSSPRLISAVSIE
jgi:hypothetical protein